MGFIWPWLSKVDPNVVLAIVGTVGGWLYHAIRKDKQASFGSIVGAVIDNLTEELLPNAPPSVTPGYLATARQYIEERVWKALAKRNVPRNALTEQLVHEGVESATAWLAEKIRERHDQSQRAPAAAPLPVAVATVVNK